MELRVTEGLGVRTYGRNISAVKVARAIVQAVEARRLVGAWSEERGCLFGDVVKYLIQEGAEGLGALKYPAAYGAVSRALPFEFAGMVYELQAGEKQQTIYQKTKRLIRKAGRLEGAALARPARKPLDDRIREAVEAAGKSGSLEGAVGAEGSISATRVVFSTGHNASQVFNVLAERLGAIEDLIKTDPNSRIPNESAADHEHFGALVGQLADCRRYISELQHAVRSVAAQLDVQTRQLKALAQLYNEWLGIEAPASPPVEAA